MARLGVTSKLYRNTGSWGTPTWVAIDKVDGLELDSGWNTSTSGDRGQGVDTVEKTTATLNITGRVKQDDSDAGYAALLAGYLSRSPIDLMVLNGASNSNGATGFRAMWHVTRFAEPQGRDVVIYRDFTLVPAGYDSTTPAQSVAVASGAPAFTTLAAV